MLLRKLANGEYMGKRRRRGAVDRARNDEYMDKKETMARFFGRVSRFPSRSAANSIYTLKSLHTP